MWQCLTKSSVGVIVAVLPIVIAGCSKKPNQTDHPASAPKSDAIMPSAPGPLGAESTAELIDRLAGLTAHHYAVRTNIIGIGEMGDGKEKLPEGLLMLQDAEPTPSEAMRELVRRGASAVPDLVAHLGDTRLTKVPIPKMMSNDFGYEYDYNRATTKPPAGVNETRRDSREGHDRPKMPEVLAVGDICFDLLGQIVNRKFKPTRYQPTLCMVVNCPSVLKEVREAAEQEWGGLTPKVHRQRLIDDASRPDFPFRAEGAVELLRRHYPGTTVPRPSTR